MRKLIATLFAAICLITAFGQVDSLKNASLIGQASRNQKVGQGFQIGFVGSSNDTMQVNTKFQLVTGSPALNKLLVSDANGFATWENKISVSSVKTDTIFTTGGTTTGQVLILVNDTTGVFANAPFVDTIYRIEGKDSIFYTIAGRAHAIKDSIGGGGGGNVINGLSLSGDTILFGGLLDRRTDIYDSLDAQKRIELSFKRVLAGTIPGSFYGVEDTYNNTYTGVIAGDFSGVGLTSRTSVVGHLDLPNNKNAIAIFSADSTGMPSLSIQGSYGSGSHTNDISFTKQSQVFKIRKGSNNWGITADTNNLSILASNNTWLWPNSDGSSGDILSTDGSGNLSWVAPSGGGGGLSVWDTANGNIYNNNAGFVGIGTSSPSSMLTVRSGDYNTFTVGNRMVWLGSDTATESSYSCTQLYQQSEANVAIAITGNSASSKGIDITGINSGGSENAVSILGLSGSMTGRGVYISGSNTEGAGDIVLYPQQGNLILQNLSPGLGKVLTDIDGSGKASWMPSSTFQADSVTIYALTPSPGTQYYCTDCSGNGITGRIVAFIGAAWRRLTFED